MELERAIPYGIASHARTCHRFFGYLRSATAMSPQFPATQQAFVTS
ncbi:hypothetical protein QUB61_32770 [Microcoleus sp. C2D2]